MGGGAEHRVGAHADAVEASLAVVIDLFSRRIVGWSMKTKIDRSLAIDALEIVTIASLLQIRRTKFRVPPMPGLILAVTDPHPLPECLSTPSQS